MEAATEQVPARTWIAVIGVLLGAFMAVLDIQITNTSLKDIQGTLSASVDEISWVSTAYLVAEIVVIPLTGWLSRVFSPRYYLAANSALFVCFSVLSGLARTLNTMIIPGALLIAAIWFALDQDELHLNELAGGDWWGVVTIAIGLGAMEIVLEERNRKDSFESPLLLRLTIVAVVFLISFLVIEFIRKDPLVNLRLFGPRNFGLGSVVNIVLGMDLYGCTYILPVYLGQIQGYDAYEIGKTVMWMGMPQLLIIPLVPRLMKHVDSRMLIAFGGGCLD